MSAIIAWLRSLCATKPPSKRCTFSLFERNSEEDLTNSFFSTSYSTSFGPIATDTEAPSDKLLLFDEQVPAVPSIVQNG
jgi:hypothetical protein